MQLEPTPKFLSFRYTLEVLGMLAGFASVGLLLINNVWFNQLTKDDFLSNGILASLRLSPRISGMFADPETQFSELRLRYVFADGSQQILPVFWLGQPLRRSLWNIPMSNAFYANGTDRRNVLIRDNWASLTCYEGYAGKKLANLVIENRVISLDQVLDAPTADRTFPETPYVGFKSYTCRP